MQPLPKYMCVCIYIVSQGHKLTAFDIKTKDAHEQLELLNKDHL